MSRVLIVDDEASIAEMLETVCKFAGADVRTAANGRAALQLLDTYQADLILTDFMMPGMDGGELLTLLRADPKLREVPVVVMTAAPEAAAKRCAGERIVAKPVDLDDLGEILRGLPSH